jgi:hypothetical protein
MKLSGTNTPEIITGIKAAADSLLDAHVDLALVFQHGRWGVACFVCGGRWAVVDAESGPRVGIDVRMVADGDGYCENGATNYFNSEGNVTKRM